MIDINKLLGQLLGSGSASGFAGVTTSILRVQVYDVADRSRISASGTSGRVIFDPLNSKIFH